MRLCRERAAREGWEVAEVYADAGLSGASLMRPGIQQLMKDALAGKFNIVLAEALDRLSRDQEDIAGVYKRLRFAGVVIITLSEGEVGDLHIGLKGTMNALFLKDLADKTRRGLRGRVEAGKSGGGNSYGYDVVKRLASDGSPLRGDRSINEAQAAVVRRIFSDYAAGKSSKAIAKQLNREGVRGPSGKGWGPSTIHGNRERGTGILNNELYIGRLVWNRLRYLKDPETGKRVSRQNPDSALIVNEVPALRIVEQALWEKVKARQQGLKVKQAKDKRGFWDRRRPRYLFSGLMKCGECGGGFVKISEHYFGCATARNKGTCTNLTAIKRDALEETVLGGLQHHLMDPALIDVFCAEYTRHLNRLRSDAVASLEGWKAEFGKVDREMERLVDAIVGGFPAAKVKDRMIELDARKVELEALIADAPEAPAVLVHPSMGERYRQEVTRLREALNEPSRREEAAEIIRGLIDAIVLRPEGDGRRKALTIDLTGHLAGILSLAGARKAEAGAPAPDRQTKLVAGIGFEPMTFRL